MGYIQKNLMQGEKVIYEAKFHGIVYFWPCLFAILAIGLFFIGSWSFLLRLILVLAVWLVAFIWGVYINGGKQYVLTTRRLICKEGIVKRTSRELLLRKCEGISIEQSILGRLLGYGSILVSTGEDKNRYDYIKNPLAFSTSINQQIDNVKDDR
ncbi:MAG: PH domain-containing protein [Prevotella sp.]|nr:PH domain-containing protein [Prevotella sp.]